MLILTLVVMLALTAMLWILVLKSYGNRLYAWYVMVIFTRYQVIVMIIILTMVLFLMLILVATVVEIIWSSCIFLWFVTSIIWISLSFLTILLLFLVFCPDVMPLALFTPARWLVYRPVVTVEPAVVTMVETAVVAMVDVIWVFAENFYWVRFLVVCFLYQNNPNTRKNICCGKKWPNCHYKTIFSCLGRLRVGEFVGFMWIFTRFPTQQK